MIISTEFSTADGWLRLETSIEGAELQVGPGHQRGSTAQGSGRIREKQHMHGHLSLMTSWGIAWSLSTSITSPTKPSHLLKIRVCLARSLASVAWTCFATGIKIDGTIWREESCHASFLGVFNDSFPERATFKSRCNGKNNSKVRRKICLLPSVCFP